jgi:hypothetical protein
MAHQQAKIERNYSKFIEGMGWEKPTMSSKDVQLGVINEFKHLLD